MTQLSLGPNDRGRKVAVCEGDRIVIRLPENPTTGYRWAGEIPDLFRVVRDENEGEGAPGGGGVRLMELEATGRGHTELSLDCGRAWDPAAGATDHFSLTIEVD